jgi:hypothetical protein
MATARATYIVCLRTSKKHLLTGAKTAVFSIVIGIIMVPTLQGLDLDSILLLQVCFFVGSI